MPDAPAPTCAMQPCRRCGRPVVTGQTAALELVAVEPAPGWGPRAGVQVDTLVWDRGAQWPRLAQSRGYVAHACGG